jgi:hypothetical protein
VEQSAAFFGRGLVNGCQELFVRGLDEIIVGISAFVKAGQIV